MSNEPLYKKDDCDSTSHYLGDELISVMSSMEDYKKTYGDMLNTMPALVTNPVPNPIQMVTATSIAKATDDTDFRLLPAFQWLNDLKENAEFKKSNDDLLKTINSGVKTEPYKNINDLLKRTNKNAFSLVTNIYNFATKEDKDKMGKPYNNEETQKYYDFLKNKLNALSKGDRDQDQDINKTTIYNNIYNVLQKVLKNAGSYKKVKVGGNKKRTLTKSVVKRQKREKINTKTRKNKYKNEKK